jgi:uncharacterized protein (TIGR03435 family)
MNRSGADEGASGDFKMVNDIVQALILIVGLIAFPRPSQTPVAKVPTFEVATIKPATPGDSSGRFATMQSGHQFVVRNYNLKDLVVFAYNLPSQLISGGPAWTETDRFNILASTPGDVPPKVAEQMLMVRKLLEDRFQFRYHQVPREFPGYELTVSKDGVKVSPSAAPVDAPSQMVNRVFPGDHIQMPARNTTMAEFASELQRDVLKRPVVDKSNLSGKYDFVLEWRYDDAQFGGQLPPVKDDNSGRPDLFAAVQQQLGLRLVSARATLDTIVIDSVQRPSEN